MAGGDRYGNPKANEMNTQSQGKSGSHPAKLKTGPVKNASGNPTSGGGINRATKGKGGGM